MHENNPNRRSFEIHKAAKPHTCIVCGKTIPKGATYLTKQEMSIYIEKSLQNSTGFSIWEIKRRTNAKYVDRITWKFCSLMCLQIFGRKPRKELPPIVQERMRAEEERIIKEYGETLTVMAKLQGQDEDDDEDYTIF